jgi:flagellar hook assembly protein FlgD
MTTPLGHLDPDTALRVTGRVGTTTTYAVETLDGNESGYVLGSSLVPRDSRGPNLWDLEDGTGAFSPNADGSKDTFDVAAELSEAVDWRLTFTDDGSVLDVVTGSGSELEASWDGEDAGSPVADGSYDWTLEAWDEWGNPPLVETGTVTVDTAAPSLDALSLTTAVPAASFSPNGDGVADGLAFSAGMSEPGDVLAHIENASHHAITDLMADAADETASLAWDGRNSGGSIVADGLYDVAVRARDRAGNVSSNTSRVVAVYGALASVATSAAVFWPHDGDTLARSTRLSFRLIRPATVTWELRRLDGTVVYTRYSGAALAAGTYAFWWAGRDQAGNLLPAGSYVSRVMAGNGTVGIAQAAKVQMNAFAIRSSDATPSRRQRITIYATSAEALRAAPRLRVEEPGLATWNVTMTRTAGLEYKATITLRSSRTGTLRVRVGGYDTQGHYQATTLAMPLG